MNTDIVSRIKALSEEFAELRKKDPRAFLSLLQQIKGAVRDLNEEFKILKQKPSE